MGLFDFLNAGRRAGKTERRFGDAALDEIRQGRRRTEARFDPFLQAGTEALPDVQRGATTAGLDANISEILDTEIFGSLRDERERSARGQLAAGGLTRSGFGVEQIANIPSELALDLEETIFGRQSQLAGTGFDAAQSLSGFDAAAQTNIADLLIGQGKAASAGIITDAKTKSKAVGEAVGIASKLASQFFFSDPRLKENVEQIAVLGDLRVYSWNWIDAVKDTIVNHCPTIGFLASEVEDKYPHHVGEFGGFLTIDYTGLHDELKIKFGSSEYMAA